MHDLRQLCMSQTPCVPQAVSAVADKFAAVAQVKLPDYSSREIVRDRLRLAVREGAGGFHLSAFFSRL